MAKKRKSTIRRLEKWVKNHKLLVSLILVIFVLIIIVFGAKVKLYVDFLLGNDIVVKLDVDKNNIYLLHGQEEQIEFETSVTTNPFCSALCNYSFEDISNYEMTDQDQFTLNPSTPLIKRYTLNPPKTGTGVALYRFNIQCRSLRTLLCHTDEESSTRSILVTVKYDLNEEERILKESLRKKLEELKLELSKFQWKQDIFQNVSDRLKEVLIFEDKTVFTRSQLNLIRREMQDIEGLWEKQDYLLLKDEIKKTEEQFKKTESIFAELNNSLSYLALSYNQLIMDINFGKGSLERLRGLVLINNTLVSAIKKTANDFIQIKSLFRKRTSLSEKGDMIKNITVKAEMLLNSAKEQIRRESVRINIENDINYDALCAITGTCIEHPPIGERANQSGFDISMTCNEMDRLRDLLASINESIKTLLIEQGYPDSDVFWNSITLKVSNIKQNLTREYLNSLPENKTNTEIIKDLLEESPFYETDDYGEYNLTAALVVELSNQEPEACNVSVVSYPSLGEVNFEEIYLNMSTPVFTGLEVEEPPFRCCVFGSCEDCCVTEECIEDSSKFPIIFLHGHAVDKRTSAEYSLEGFNKIQEKLEEDGYLNAGSVTLYTGVDSPEGLWGMLPVPLTIRASYYFDIFKQPENYLVVQTKSENIDTYSVRLKELVDVVKYKTGRPKVNIIAFSMGGLVARRYIQIFGSGSVDKLILMGTPNKGIEGDIADYCPIIGEKLECKDMNSQSLFINKLNREPLPEIPIYNIIGSGCQMKKKDGDGVVSRDSAWLEGANNHIVNGTCTSVTKPLHLAMRDIDLYPEVYEIIKEALK